MIPNKNIDKIYSYLLLLFCFAIPFIHLAKAVPNIILISLVLLYPFHSSRNSIKSIKKELFFIVLFIVIITINTLLFERWEDFKRILGLAYIPLIVLLFFPTKEIKPYLKAFLISAFLLLFISSIRLALKFAQEGNLDIAVGAEVTQILLGERPYLGFLYFMAACFSFYLCSFITKKAYRVCYFVLGILFCFFVFLIVARIMLLAIIVSVVLALFYLRGKLRFYAQLIGLLFLFLIGLLYIFSDNVSTRFYMDEEQESNVITADPRYHIWDCAYRIMPKNTKEFIFGKGYANTYAELSKCYQEKKDFRSEFQQKWFIDSKFNTHNQFFDLLLTQGVIVFGACLFFFGYATIKNRKNFFVISLLLTTFLFFSVENVLNRQIGCILVAFVLYFVFKEKNAISGCSTKDNPAT